MCCTVYFTPNFFNKCGSMSMNGFRPVDRYRWKEEMEFTIRIKISNERGREAATADMLRCNGNARIEMLE